MTLELLVTRAEDNQLMPKKFAKLSFYEADPSTLLVESAAPNWGRYQDQINDSYTPLALANQYVEAIQMLHRYFQGIVSHKWNPEDLFQKLLLAKFTYASFTAHQLIRPGVAHYNGKYEIFVSLPEDKTLADVKRYSIHGLI